MMLLRGYGAAGLWGWLMLLLVACTAWASEITFELPDNAEQCFYEEIVQGTKCTLEFQVITGGHYDVDCQLEGPDGSLRLLNNSLLWEKIPFALQAITMLEENSHDSARAGNSKQPAVQTRGGQRGQRKHRAAGVRVQRPGIPSVPWCVQCRESMKPQERPPKRLGKAAP